MSGDRLMSMVEALNRGLSDAMREDPTVVVFGEDVETLGGVFRVTAGIAAEHGRDRCFDTPLAESGIAGFAVGMAIAGFRPVVEMQYDAFCYPAMEQIFSHIAKMRNRTRGYLSLPMVIRVPSGGGIGGLEHHSDSSEAYFAHTPGLKVVFPATVADSYSLMREAIEDPDPVVFFEPKALYWSREAVQLPGRTEAFGQAVVRRAGTFATIVAYGPAMPVALAAAEVASQRLGVDLQVVDIRTIVPFDDATVARAVRSTGRCIVVQQAQGFAGVAAEIAARVQEGCFSSLRAPVLRVTGLDIPYPPPRLEETHLPSVSRVLDSVGQLLARPASRSAAHRGGAA